MSNYTLYYGPGTCSMVAHIALIEAGAPFVAQRIVLAEGQHLQPEFLAVNPKGLVPALQHEGQVLTELLAILSWLDLRYPQAQLLPNDPWQRGRAMEWLCWLSGTVHGTHFAGVFRPARFVAESEAQAAVKAHAKMQVSADMHTINTRLQGRDHALDSGYSMVDVYLLVLFRWGLRIGLSMRADYPAYAALVDRVRQRPAVQQAMLTEGLDLADFG
jgi:glutathione S-transferase